MHSNSRTKGKRIFFIKRFWIVQKWPLRYLYRKASQFVCVYSKRKDAGSCSFASIQCPCVLVGSLVLRKAMETRFTSPKYQRTCQSNRCVYKMFLKPCEQMYRFVIKFSSLIFSWALSFCQKLFPGHKTIVSNQLYNTNLVVCIFEPPNDYVKAIHGLSNKFI